MQSLIERLTDEDALLRQEAETAKRGAKATAERERWRAAGVSVRETGAHKSVMVKNVSSRKQMLPAPLLTVELISEFGGRCGVVLEPGETYHIRADRKHYAIKDGLFKVVQEGDCT